MNLDVNTLSMLLQLTGKSGDQSGKMASMLGSLLSGVRPSAPSPSSDSPSETRDRYNFFGGTGGADPCGGNGAYAGNGGARNLGDASAAMSPFARQNGLGDKVDLFAAQRQSAPSDPLASMLNMLKGGAQGGDMQSGAANMQQGGNADMASMLPMLLNLFKRPAQTACSTADTSKNSGSESNISERENSNDKDCGNARSHEGASCDTSQTDVNRSRPTACRADKFAPISFAGYPTLSALNLLLGSKRTK